MDLRDLEVKKGQPVLPAWERLKEWARRFELHAGMGVRFNQMPEGTWVIAESDAASWNFPFRVTMSAVGLKVGAGSVDNLIPQLGGVGIDGLDDKGGEVSVPDLKTSSGPNSFLRSWVCVQLKVNLKTGRVDPKDKTALTIIHASSQDTQTADTGLQPLATLIWSDKTTIKRLVQVVHHNLVHAFVPANAAKSQSARHFFWAV